MIGCRKNAAFFGRAAISQYEPPGLPWFTPAVLGVDVRRRRPAVFGASSLEVAGYSNRHAGHERPLESDSR